MAKAAAKKAAVKDVAIAHYDVILSPVITEKSTQVSEHNQVVFHVARDATKPAIKAAVATARWSFEWFMPDQRGGGRAIAAAAGLIRRPFQRVTRSATSVWSSIGGFSPMKRRTSHTT